MHVVAAVRVRSGNIADYHLLMGPCEANNHAAINTPVPRVAHSMKYSQTPSCLRIKH